MLRTLRWAIFGKNLDEILAVFDQTQQELEEFNSRTNQRRVRVEQRAAALRTMAERFTRDIDRANLVHGNLEILMTQHLGTGEETNP